GAKPQDAQVADDLRVQPLQAELQDRRLPLLFDPLQDLLAGLGDDLFDPGRMDASIHDELVQRDPRNLAAHGVEPADDHGLGGVVDEELDPRGPLESAYVASLLAAAAGLRLAGWQREH